MDKLTERQNQILKALIEEYIETAEPVGSETLDKKYNLGISPATIRNEMVKLTSTGFLVQPHTSAGRSPSSKGLRYYVENLMTTKKLSVTEEVSVKEKVWNYRYQLDKFLRETTKVLAQKTGSLALSATDQGDFFFAGTANILSMPEFFDIDLTKNLLLTLDKFDFWNHLFFENTTPEEVFHIILGSEMSENLLEPCGFVFSSFQIPSKGKGAIGIVGPSRLSYPSIIPTVKYFGDLVSEIALLW
ncbi:hypothetical protein ISS85_02395 [Candidatus Microgenomates bacterium]|nr:hypothetical protein [Candidatus Microgenomates bacterium]